MFTPSHRLYYSIELQGYKRIAGICQCAGSLLVAGRSLKRGDIMGSEEKPPQTGQEDKHTSGHTAQRSQQNRSGSRVFGNLCPRMKGR